jgi:hypothetical protein
MTEEREQPAPAAPSPNRETVAGPAPRSTFEQRVDAFGREVGAAGERIGREAEAMGQRLSKDPGVQRAADSAARVWGLIVLAIGVWFLADVTIGLDMPAVPWADLWPLGLILIGLFVVLRGMRRRSA